MAQISHSNIVTYDGNEWLVNSNGSGIRQKSMKTILKQYHAMLDVYSRVFVLRIDLHAKSDTQTNDDIRSLLKDLKDYLVKYYDMKKFGYVWAREITTRGNPHYHLALFLNGAKIRFPHCLNAWISSTWKHTFKQPHCYHPEQCYSMTGRADIQSQADIIYRLSYLAKDATKDSSNVKSMGNSRLKRTSKRPPTALHIPTYVIETPLHWNRVMAKKSIVRN